MKTKLNTAQAVEFIIANKARLTFKVEIFQSLPCGDGTLDLSELRVYDGAKLLYRVVKVAIADVVAFKAAKLSARLYRRLSSEVDSLIEAK